MYNPCTCASDFGSVSDIITLFLIELIVYIIHMRCSRTRIKCDAHKNIVKTNTQHSEPNHATKRMMNYEQTN